MKFVVISIFGLISNVIICQIDDLTFKPIRFTGISGSFGFMSAKYSGLTTNQLKPIFTGDLSLDQNYTNDYTYAPYFIATNGLSSFQLELKTFYEINTMKKVNLEGFIGFRFANTILAGGYYSQKNPLKTNEIYQSSNSANILEKQSITRLDASYGIYGNTLFLPMGINLNTKKSRIVWLNAGLEFSPGLTINKVYESTITESKQTTYIENGAVQQGFGKNISYDQITLHHYSERITKPSMMLMMSMPFGVNIRLGKKMPVLKHTNILFLIAPNWTYRNTSYLGSSHGFGMQSSLGLNFRW
jgi:hypothetical protein